MSEVSAENIDVLNDIFMLDLNSCDVAVCLASVQHKEAIPIYMILDLSPGLTQTFREVVSSLTEGYRKEWQKRNILLRYYAPESKPDDYEIELLDLSQYNMLSKQIEPLVSFQDLGVFEEEEEFIANLRFYCIIARPPNNEPIYFYRSYTHKKMLSKSSFFAIWRGQYEYDRVKVPIFLFDKYIDCISCGNNMFILQKENFQRIFYFLEEVEKVAKQTLAQIKLNLPIANFDHFAEACKRNPNKLRKLKNIAKQPYLDRVTMDDIKKVIQMHNLNIPIITTRSGKEMIVYEQSEPWEILKLLDDDYLRSVMTSQNYEVTGKRVR